MKTKEVSKFVGSHLRGSSDRGDLVIGRESLMTFEMDTSGAEDRARAERSPPEKLLNFMGL